MNAFIYYCFGADALKSNVKHFKNSVIQDFFIIGLQIVIFSPCHELMIFRFVFSFLNQLIKINNGPNK